MADIPSLVNHYNVYRDGNKLVGVSGEVELPDFENMTDTIEGTGIAGEMDDPATGQFQSMKVTIPFAVLYDSQFTLADTNNPPTLTLRGSEQVLDSASGATKDVPVRVVLRGKCTKNSLGKIAKGKKGEPSVEIEVTYIKVEVNGETQVELDKLNFIYVVNGVDLMAQIRKNC